MSCKLEKAYKAQLDAEKKLRQVKACAAKVNTWQAENVDGDKIQRFAHADLGIGMDADSEAFRVCEIKWISLNQLRALVSWAEDLLEDEDG